MNSRERFLEIMNFGSPDRILKWKFGYWRQTLRRWYREGLPEKFGLKLPDELGKTVTGPAALWGDMLIRRDRDKDVANYFGLDSDYRPVCVELWIHPHFEEKMLQGEVNLLTGFYD